MENQEKNKDQEKKDEKPSDRNLVGSMMKVIIGLALLVLGGISILNWWPELLVLVRGAVGLFLILAGVITLAIARE